MKLKTIILLTALVFSTAALAQNNKVVGPLADDNGVVDNTGDSISKANTARPVPGSSRKGSNPVAFYIGDSTMRNGTLGNGNNGQWGWGFFADKYFDRDKITVENQALGGMSTRTFYNKLWPDIREALKPGDWVIVSLGHNDNGPYDSGRARACIPGTGNETLDVTIKETGDKETVYTYGGYMRKYISEIRAAGANPVLMSLTPRNAYDEQGKAVRKKQTEWLKQIAAEEKVPFIDLNEISGKKLDSYSTWKKQYMFYKDKIHTSRFGAEMNARSAAEGIAQSTDPALAPLQAMMKDVALPVEKVKRQDGKPVVFITGDSTVKNQDKKEDGMWGWGSQAYNVFDADKIVVANCAKAGRSTRSFLNEGRWEKVYNSLQPGDYVIIEFGHNDQAPTDKKPYRGTIRDSKDTCKVYKMEGTGKYELVYSFGWYLKKFIDDVREKGATPILVSLTPRNRWKDGKIERRMKDLGKWYRDVAKETGVEFVDLHNVAADYYDGIGEEATKEYFMPDRTHTAKKGAQQNAQSLAKALKDANSSLAKYLK